MERFELKRTYLLSERACKEILENLAEYNESDGDDDEAFYESGVYAFEGDFDVGYCDNRKEFDTWILSKVYEYAQKHGSNEEKIAIERFKRLKK